MVISKVLAEARDALAAIGYDNVLDLPKNYLVALFEAGDLRVQAGYRFSPNETAFLIEVDHEMIFGYIAETRWRLGKVSEQSNPKYFKVRVFTPENNPPYCAPFGAHIEIQNFR